MDLFGGVGQGRKIKEYPIGTTRQWAAGLMVKWDSKVGEGAKNWSVVSIPPKMEQALKRVQSNLNSLARVQDPISGERLVDKVIDRHAAYHKDKYPNDWKNKHGMAASPIKNGVPELTDWHNWLKKSDMSGRAYYDAVTPFMFKHSRKRIIAKLQKRYPDGNVGGKDIDGVLPEEIPCPASFLYSLDEKVNEAKKFVTEGHDALTSKQKDAAHNARELREQMHSLEDYKDFPYVKAREAMRNAKKDLDTLMPESGTTLQWIWNVSMKEQIQRGFETYKRRFNSEVRRDLAELTVKEIGVDATDPAKKFYKGLYTKIDQLKKKGKAPSDELAISELMEMRFEMFYDKEVKGDWDATNVTALENFEHLLSDLPPGHAITNKAFKQISNHQGGHDGAASYAHYSPGQRAISLSDAATGHARRNLKGDMTNLVEFSSVVVHEIGHALSAKLRDAENYQYKTFVKLTGWDNRQVEIEELGGMATAGQRAMERRGSRNAIPLISDYAHMSPEEAFAEYYSCYYNNIDAIDSWLDTGSEKSIKQHKFTHTFKSRIDKHKSLTRDTVGIKYRDTGVSIQTMRLNEATFRHMRDSIFRHKKVQKALENIL